MGVIAVVGAPAEGSPLGWACEAGRWCRSCPPRPTVVGAGAGGCRRSWCAGWAAVPAWAGIVGGGGRAAGWSPCPFRMACGRGCRSRPPRRAGVRFRPWSGAGVVRCRRQWVPAPVDAGRSGVREGLRCWRLRVPARVGAGARGCRALEHAGVGGEHAAGVHGQRAGERRPCWPVGPAQHRVAVRPLRAVIGAILGIPGDARGG